MLNIFKKSEEKKSAPAKKVGQVMSAEELRELSGGYWNLPLTCLHGRRP